VIRKIVHAFVLLVSVPAIHEEPEDHAPETEYVLHVAPRCRGGAGE
jgi:hypothetical protein